ncbi:glutamine synthetase family protein [uncultured Aquitalea sp.]|uniref:glutamine synthetase family protein n=1 Tax=uncultured Aquitalea sp. TaxID=540272 RepID=UPI0025E25C76|nr:glutamine synthetase family protein [uncultured Aquitalea sp.]
MNQIGEWLHQHGVRHVECLFSDLTGSARGKLLPTDTLIATGELRFSQVALVQSVTGDCLQELVPELDPDMRLVADAASLRMLPWTREPTALLIHDCLYEDGTPVPFSPRNVLKRVLARYTELGLRPVVAPEMEFYLFAPRERADQPPMPPRSPQGMSERVRQPYSLDRLQEQSPAMDAVLAGCQTMGLRADTLLHEVGNGQLEINLLHGDALELADQAFLFKRLVRQTANEHGLQACFMAKPLADDAGSAMHIHQSLVWADSGRNAFSQEDGAEAPRFGHYIAGLQRYLPEALLLLAPYVNSYRRLAPFTAAPINVEWGYDNRTCGLRIPHCNAHSRRVENRLPGVDVNPYLAMAATLACGLLGLTEERQPSAPLSGSAYGRPYAFPRTQLEAIERLQACQPLINLLGTEFVGTYSQLKQSEWREFNRQVTAWEHRYLLDNV